MNVREIALTPPRVFGSVLVASLWVGSLAAQAPGSAMPDSVRAYVRDAMMIFRTNSLHQAEVNWPALEDSVVARSGNAQTPDGTWRALTWALRSVDPHSFLMPPPSKMAAMLGGIAAPSHAASAAPASPAAAQLLDGHVAYVSVPPHSGANRPAYVDSLHAQLGALDRTAICGWIVDLRDDSGGNMWPMLAGIGPLLGAEAVGSFTNSRPGAAWRYRDGRSWSGDSTLPAESAGWGTAPAPRLTHADAPVALLIGRTTASSGEMTLLAFLGRAQIRSFGDSTAGFTSSNTTVPLRDGATLIVTSSYPRDRLGRTYPLRVAPDEPVPAGKSAAGDDATVAAAVTWLREQKACAAYR